MRRRSPREHSAHKFALPRGGEFCCQRDTKLFAHCCQTLQNSSACHIKREGVLLSKRRIDVPFRLKVRKTRPREKRKPIKVTSPPTHRRAASGTIPRPPIIAPDAPQAPRRPADDGKVHRRCAVRNKADETWLESAERDFFTEHRRKNEGEVEKKRPRPGSYGQNTNGGRHSARPKVDTALSLGSAICTRSFFSATFFSPFVASAAALRRPISSSRPPQNGAFSPCAGRAPRTAHTREREAEQMRPFSPASFWK